MSNNTAKKKKAASSSIAQNKKARHDYHIEDRYEAGLVLEGWEVKSLRAGKVQLRDGYVLLKGGEAFLFGSLITPPPLGVNAYLSRFATLQETAPEPS